ncbi:MAG: hypothetical protein A3K67_04040 [Euryarchaeota archaeon RBG_16_62_10]|nr:MAG: hypothetical protein A3K67_04040 [Euryarchaeota archaeon RBG_16_62_10]
MATEFELSVAGNTKNLLDSIAVLADQKINLTTVATARVDDRYVVKFITGDDEEVRRTFMKADISFKERPVLVVNVHNRPGEWVKVARCLVNGGVEINASYLLSQNGATMRFVFVVDNHVKAKDIAKQIAECSVD